MLTQEEQEEQQAVLQELLADPDEGMDGPVVRRARTARTAALPRPAVWSRAVVAGALSSHVMLVLGLLTGGLLQGSESLLVASAFLAPPAALCSLLAILLVRSHLNGRSLLIGILTLPLNVFLCLALYGIMSCACGTKSCF